MTSATALLLVFSVFWRCQSYETTGMTSGTALLLIFSDLCAVKGAPAAFPRDIPPVVEVAHRRFPASQASCPEGEFDLNTEPRLDFKINHTITSGSKKQLECNNCDKKSGVPPQVNCSNSNNDPQQLPVWFCEGIFLDTRYVIKSVDVACEDSLYTKCVKSGSCSVKITAGIAAAVDWLLFFFLFQIAIILVGLAVYKYKGRVKTMLFKRKGNRPDLTIDVVEARRRGREEIKRLRGLQATAGTTTTTTILPPEHDLASQESHAMKAPASAWLE